MPKIQIEKDKLNGVELGEKSGVLIVVVNAKTQEELEEKTKAISQAIDKVKTDTRHIKSLGIE